MLDDYLNTEGDQRARAVELNPSKMKTIVIPNNPVASSINTRQENGMSVMPDTRPQGGPLPVVSAQENQMLDNNEPLPPIIIDRGTQPKGSSEEVDIERILNFKSPKAQQ